MKDIKLNNLVSKLVYALVFLLGNYAFSQTRPGVPVPVNPGGGVGGVGPGGAPKNPIDMYEGVLLMVAIVMMVGYYLYTRNRKAIA